MIKTTVTLTCDRCGREIKAGETYYMERVSLLRCPWNGVKQTLLDEAPEERSRDLCEECRIELYGPATVPEGDLGIQPAEEADDSFVDLIPSPEECAKTQEGIAEPATEPATVAEDVETGETVELGHAEASEKSEKSETVEMDGKEYTEYAPDAREAAEKIVAIAEKKRGKRKSLTDAQKEQIVHMIQGGATYNKIAKTVGCSPQTVCNVWHKYVTGQDK